MEVDQGKFIARLHAVIVAQFQDFELADRVFDAARIARLPVGFAASLGLGSVTLPNRARNKSPGTSGSRRSDGFTPRLQGRRLEGFETIKRLEGMEGQLSETRVATINAIQAALEKAGVEFIAENGGGAGVRLKKRPKGVEKISQQIDALEDKISSIPAPTEPSPEAAMNKMRKAVAESDLTKLKTRRKRIRSDRSK